VNWTTDAALFGIEQLRRVCSSFWSFRTLCSSSESASVNRRARFEGGRNDEQQENSTYAQPHVACGGGRRGGRRGSDDLRSVAEGRLQHASALRGISSGGRRCIAGLDLCNGRAQSWSLASPESYAGGGGIRFRLGARMDIRPVDSGDGPRGNRYRGSGCRARLVAGCDGIDAAGGWSIRRSAALLPAMPRPPVPSL